jgi:hypothetical protein
MVFERFYTNLDQGSKTMTKLFAALVLTIASLNVVACASNATQNDSTAAAAEERANRAEALANDSLRK